MIESSYRFEPEPYEPVLTEIIEAIDRLDPLERADYESLLRRYPKDGRGFFSKAEILCGFRHLNRKLAWNRDERTFADKIRMKPVRTLSGVAPVTVLTKPYPCPGRCIFCPSDVRMPKSYLSDEPGAQRAAEHQFDPYRQTLSRLRALHNIGHRLDKVELIILGGTWSHYPEGYQIWFVKRCFEALNAFGRRAGSGGEWPDLPAVDYRIQEESVDGATLARTYNEVVRDFARRFDEAPTDVSWDDLEAVQRANERAASRCVGLVVETRPDHLDLAEAVRVRRLGVTKVQIGFQSLDDRVLAVNKRGHDVEATRRAVKLLRQMGFKIHAHWMSNLHGSSPEADVADYRRLFADPDFRPDELKIYPCSLIESAELMREYERGAWRPYTHEELLDVLTACLTATPPYCRLTRVIRDIPGTDIVDGNRLTNFRELAEREVERRGGRLVEIRTREIGEEEVARDRLRLERIGYRTSSGTEAFLQFVDRDGRLAGFLRLALPAKPAPIAEIRASAIIREVHVYGRVVEIGGRAEGRSQHLGLGRALVDAATRIAALAGFADLAVISSVGTREYYRSLGFEDGDLYQHRPPSR
jgi:elongator complex protein 3